MKYVYVCLFVCFFLFLTYMDLYGYFYGIENAKHGGGVGVVGRTHWRHGEREREMVTGGDFADRQLTRSLMRRHS